MIIVKTQDIEEIRKVICHPDIYPVISDDFCPPPKEFIPPLDVDYYAGYVNGEIIGIMAYHIQDGRYKCHPNVLPEYRNKYAREFTRMTLEIGKVKNASIYADIPECYKHVIRFAKSFGFKVIGKLKNKSKRNNVLYDVISLRLI